MSQCCRRIAGRTTMLAKSNCLRDSSSGFILRVYPHSLSCKRVIRKAAEVWCHGCLHLERLTHACLTRSSYPGFNDFSLSNKVLVSTNMKKIPVNAYWLIEFYLIFYYNQKFGNLKHFLNKI